MYYFTDELIYATDADGCNFLHSATVYLSGSDMNRLLTELLQLNILTKLLNTRAKYNRTPLCVAANRKNRTNVDVIVEIVKFILHHVLNPGTK